MMNARLDPPMVFTQNEVDPGAVKRAT